MHSAMRAVLAAFATLFTTESFKAGLRRSFVAACLAKDEACTVPAYRTYTGPPRPQALIKGCDL